MPALNPEVPHAMEAFADLPVPVEIRVGARQMAVEEIARLGVGATLGLLRQTSEPLDILVGDVRIAGGRVVVVDNRVTVRITELDLSPLEETAGNL